MSYVIELIGNINISMMTRDGRTKSINNLARIIMFIDGLSLHIVKSLNKMIMEELTRRKQLIKQIKAKHLITI